MAKNAKIVVLVAVLALLQVSCAVARRHGKPGPCDEDADAADLVDLSVSLRHKKTPHHHHGSHHHCSPARHGGHGGGTPAVMTLNGFQHGETGGGPSACDGHFHSDGELIVALSTEWFARGQRCHRTIRITSAHHGRTVEARVVDECDSSRGCRHNIVDSSPAVWKALGLDTDVGEVPVTWSDA
ncbi:putative ripening-related protein 7 [Dichanthelium oligosanthes]|uniref:Putative ripening-related protein 7 n=1 Tax=Dichanthelium oligosanthes TaxID=888268 RepID=A0A1E5UIR5_9POAL|nr:putative ripening-related protein 7 [Dichanthelium oligosanthes]